MARLGWNGLTSAGRASKIISLEYNGGGNGNFDFQFIDCIFADSDVAITAGNGFNDQMASEATIVRSRFYRNTVGLQLVSGNSFNWW